MVLKVGTTNVGKFAHTKNMRCLCLFCGVRHHNQRSMCNKCKKKQEFKMTKQKTIRCVLFKQDNGEPGELYRIDREGDGDRLFYILNQIGEIGDKLEIVALSPSEWKEAERIGEQMA